MRFYCITNLYICECHIDAFFIKSTFVRGMYIDKLLLCYSLWDSLGKLPRVFIY